MPRTSIITPTKDRQNFLPHLWECIRAQTEQDFEWLIHDSSAAPATFDFLSDPKVHYEYEQAPMEIGAKRNWLCNKAAGEIIVQFDDDDYYAPHYVTHMSNLMDAAGADFIKLFGFYLYHADSQSFAYWDLVHEFPVHWVLAPQGVGVTYPQCDAYRGGADARWGYGFSYVFRKKVWQAIKFPNQGHGEDQIFANNAIMQFESIGIQDRQRLCIHVLHKGNTSLCVPQQILPRDRMKELFPHFAPK